MSVKVEPMVREFLYNGVRIPDPNAKLSLDQVRDALTPMYVEIATATLTGPRVVNGKLQYEFARAIGLKS